MLEGAKKSNGGKGKVVNGGDSTTVQIDNDKEYTVEEVENPVPEEPHKKEITPYEGTGTLGGVNVGDEITYEISYMNYKTVAADVVIKDKLDANVEFVKASDGGANASGTVTWTLKAVPAGANGKVTLTVKVLEGALTSTGSKVVNGGESTTVKVGNDSEYHVEEVENPVESAEATIIKIWKDNDNKTGRRPESLTVSLLADGDPARDKEGKAITATLNEANEWKETVEDLPKYKFKDGQGITIVYTWSEDVSKLPAGYELTDITSNGTVTTITNTLFLGSLKITKTFQGVPEDADVSGLNFKIEGPEGFETVNVTYGDFTEENGSKYYLIEDLLPGRYVVTETNPFDLITNYSLDVENSTISAAPIVTAGDKPTEAALTNIYTEDKGNLEIAKEWCFSPADAVNEDQMKQLKVTVTNSEGYYVDVKDGKGVITDKKGEDKVELTISDGKRLEIKDLPIDTYTVTETNADGLITGYSVNSAVPSVTSGSATTVNGATVTVVLKNNYERDYGKLQLKKTWSIEGVTKVPDSAKGGLYFEISATDVEDFEPIKVYYAQFAGADTYTVENLPIGTYTVKEYLYDKLLDSYGYDFTGDADSLTKEGNVVVKDKTTEVEEFKNEYKQRVNSLTITKTFEGTPSTATEEVLGKLAFVITGPNDFREEITYADFKNGAYTRDNLPEGTYTVTETNAETLIDRYHLVVDESTTEGKAEIKKDEAAEPVELTNTYAPDEGALEIMKTFVGTPEGADLDGMIFHIVGVDATGAEIFNEDRTYADFKGGRLTIADLMVGTYTVTEEEPEGGLIENYTLSDASIKEGEAEVVLNATATVGLVNIYEQDKGKLTIRKTFTGAPRNADLTGLNFHIESADGEFATDVSYAAFTGDSYTLEDLPVGEYTVTETNAEDLIANYVLQANSVTEGSGTVVKDEEVTVELTNVYEPGSGSLIIVKTFSGLTANDDASDLEFRILGPNNFDQTVTYGEFTGGSYTLRNLTPGNYLVYESNANGLNPAWSLLSSSVTAAGTTVALGGTGTVNLTNNYDVPQTSVSVLKIWDDLNNLDESRPASLNVNLMNGSTVVKTVTLTEGNGWAAEVDGLPLFDAGGALINYTWSEDTVAGYTLSSQRTLGNVTILTNTHVPELISVSVKKVWDDNNDAYKMRPAVLRVTLSNGMSAVLTESNGWSATIDGLPKYKNGALVNYTWSEQEVLGYTRSGYSVRDGVTTFTNSYRRRPRNPGEPPIIIEEYGTPLGIDIIINHVGDCFD